MKQSTGMTDTEWWNTGSPHLAEAFTAEDDPVASRVGQVAGETYGAHDPQGSFAFGLAGVLDGLARFIDGKGKQRPKPRRR
ncbi:MAG: hypothetical protein SFX73_34445 [Kofleriaceae bacterium]|nr:hypothetical protein [Kofleriaceae bacterium]